MSDVKITVHGVGSFNDSLTGKENADGVICTFEDGTVVNSALSWKSLRMLLTMKFTQAPPRKPQPVNGPVPEVKK